MNLSNRLKAVATLVDIGVKVIDVGCDHAYLDIYLTLNNDNKCLATDINKNALNIAKENIKKHKLQNRIETKLTDGLNDIEVNSDDNIVICGMGTHTILDILKTNTLSNTLIISSNNDIELLREEVIKLGYIIDSEIFIIDKNKPYIIIKFINGIKMYSKVDIKYGPILRKNLEYKKYLIFKTKQVLNSIPKKKVFIRLKYLFNLIILKFI